MNTRMTRAWRLAKILGGTLVFVGCAEKSGVINAQSPAVTEAAGANQPNAVVSTNAAVKKEEAKTVTKTVIPSDLSPGLAEIVRLAESGVGDEVILAFIKKSSEIFDLTADEIVYLNDLGLSDALIAALMERGQANSAMRIGATTVPRTNTTPMVAEVAPANKTEEKSTVQAGTPRTRTVTTVTTTESYPEVEYANPQAEYQNSVGAVAETATVPYTEAPAQNVTINNFYDTLAPYGNWVDVDNYGRCWRPTVAIVNHSWRPYHDRGRWLYSDSGWYWQSDYSWGWAPFHYGRWHSHSGLGWLWVPGEVWGPAWVSWRRSSYYAGWAPLPPEAYYDVGFGFSYFNSRVGLSFEFGLRDHHYSFLPVSRFCDRYPSRYYVPHGRAGTIYNNSTVMNNYINGNNNTIINEGVGRDYVARASRSEVRKVALRDVNPAQGTSTKPDRFVNDGTALAVYRPRFAPASRPSGATSTADSPKGSSGVAAISKGSEPSKISGTGQRPALATDFAQPSRPTLAKVQAMNGIIRKDTPDVTTKTASPSAGMIRPGFSSVARPGNPRATVTGTGQNNASSVASISRPVPGEKTTAPAISRDAKTSETKSSSRLVTPLNNPARTAPGPKVTPQFSVPQGVVSSGGQTAPVNERPRFSPSTSRQNEAPKSVAPGRSAGKDWANASPTIQDAPSVRSQDHSGSVAARSQEPRSYNEAPRSSDPARRVENGSVSRPKNEVQRPVVMPPSQSSPSRPQFNPAPSAPRPAPRFEQPQTPKSYSPPQVRSEAPAARPHFSPAPAPRYEPPQVSRPSISRPAPAPAPAPRSEAPRSESPSSRPGFKSENRR